MPQAQVPANPWHQEEAKWDTNQHAQNKRTKSTQTSFLFPKRGYQNAKRTEKHKDKKTYHDLI